MGRIRRRDCGPTLLDVLRRSPRNVAWWGEVEGWVQRMVRSYLESGTELTWRRTALKLAANADDPPEIPTDQACQFAATQVLERIQESLPEDPKAALKTIGEYTHEVGLLAASDGYLYGYVRNDVWQFFPLLAERLGSWARSAIERTVRQVAGEAPKLNGLIDDIHQTIFTRLLATYRPGRGLTNPQALRGWLQRVICNEVATQWEHLQTHPHSQLTDDQVTSGAGLPRRGETVENGLDRRECREDLARSLLCLQQEWRDAFVLMVLLGVPARVVADQREVSEQTPRDWLSSAITQLSLDPRLTAYSDWFKEGLE